MTTVDQTTHFMRAVSASDVLADARVVRLGRTMSFGRVTLLVRHRQQAGGDGLERVRDAVAKALQGGRISEAQSASRIALQRRIAWRLSSGAHSRDPLARPTLLG